MRAAAEQLICSVMDDRGTQRKNPFWTGEAAIVRPFRVKPESRTFACDATRLFFEGKREYSLAVRTGEPYMNMRRSRSCALPGP